MTDAELLVELRGRPANYKTVVGPLVPVTEAEYSQLGCIAYRCVHTSSWDAYNRYYKRIDLNEWLHACEQRVAVRVAEALGSPP